MLITCSEVKSGRALSSTGRTGLCEQFCNAFYARYNFSIDGRNRVVFPERHFKIAEVFLPGLLQIELVTASGYLIRTGHDLERGLQIVGAAGEGTDHRDIGGGEYSRSRRDRAWAAAPR